MTRKPEIGGTSDLFMYFYLKNNKQLTFSFFLIYLILFYQWINQQIFSALQVVMLCVTFSSESQVTTTHGQKNIYAIIWSIIEMDRQLKHPFPGQPVAVQ